MKTISYLSYDGIFPEYLISGTSFSMDTESRGQNFALHTLKRHSDLEATKMLRQDLCRQLKMDHLITLKQTHSSIVHCITAENVKSYINNPLLEGDALITDMSNILIGILTADCIPILYLDSVKHVIAACHAGWKGLKQGIHVKVLKKMHEKYSCDSSDIQVLIAPHIRACCYEVDEKFTDNFPLKYFIKKTHKPHFNMSGLLQEDLIKKGILKENIFDTKECVYYNNKHKYYSYRNGDLSHRILSFVGITGNKA